MFSVAVLQKPSLMSLSHHRTSLIIAVDMAESYSPSYFKPSLVFDGPGHCLPAYAIAVSKHRLEHQLRSTYSVDTIQDGLVSLQ